jgi:hypothetical protein
MDAEKLWENFWESDGCRFFTDAGHEAYMKYAFLSGMMKAIEEQRAQLVSEKHTLLGELIR